MSLLAQDRRRAGRVGAITLVAMAAVCAGLVFLLGRGGLGATVQFRVLLRHSAGLHDGAPLVVAGQPVGRIAAITPVPHGAAGPLGGEIGVAVTVEVASDERWKVPARAEIFVASRGPLSDRYLEVAPPAGELGPPVADGAELRGVDPPTLDSVLQHAWANVSTFQRFVDAVHPELTALRGQLAELAARWSAIRGDVQAAGGIDGLADATRGLLAAAEATHDTALGGAPGVAHLRATVAEAQAAVAEIRAAIGVLAPQAAALAANLARADGHLSASAPAARAAQILATLRAALDKIDPLLAAAGEVAARIASGEGSIGRVLSDPEFPEDSKELGKILKRHPWRILERPPD